MKFYFRIIGLFFQGAKLYRIDLNDFNKKGKLERFKKYKFLMPTEKELGLFEKLYEKLPDKMEVIKRRFECGNYLCFAYQDLTNERLAYTRWLCRDTFYSDAMRKQLDLKSDEVLTMDSYTHPDYRYLGLHKNINILMLQWLKANTSIQYVYMVIFMFIPHLSKIPLELGYKPIEKTYYYKKGSVRVLFKLVKDKLRG